MAERVLSTQAARDAIQSMQNIINGPLVDQFAALNREGQTLSQPEVWDGNLARQFRSDWEATRQSLDQTREFLEQLRANIRRINDNIMTAGGN